MTVDFSSEAMNVIRLAHHFLSPENNGTVKILNYLLLGSGTSCSLGAHREKGDVLINLAYRFSYNASVFSTNSSTFSCQKMNLSLVFGWGREGSCLAVCTVAQSVDISSVFLFSGDTWYPSFLEFCRKNWLAFRCCFHLQTFGICFLSSKILPSFHISLVYSDYIL